MQVRRLESADAPIEQIDRLAGNNFFSTSSFANVWKAIGGNPVYWTAFDGSDIVALLPGVEFGKGILKRFQSMPDGCYSSVLFNQTQDRSRAELLISNAIAKAGYMKVFVNDFHNLFSQMNNFKAEKCTTYLVNISSRQWEPIDSKLRQQIHKAERLDLRLEKFELSSHLEQFMKLAALHEKRRNIKLNYNREFFEALARVSAIDDRIKWIWCEHDGNPVASHIFIVEGESILHWQMYYDEKYSDLQATKYIPFKVAREAAEQGARTLNLGSTPEDAEGTEFYKSKWGGEEYGYICYVRKSILGRLF